MERPEDRESHETENHHPIQNSKRHEATTSVRRRGHFRLPQGRTLKMWDDTTYNLVDYTDVGRESP